MTEYKFDVTYVDSSYNYATHRTDWLAEPSLEAAFQRAMALAFSKFGGSVRGITLADTY